jgi:hypothetical protein
MNLLANIFIYVCFVRILWLSIFKEGAYPNYTSIRLKRIHATILFFVMVYAWSSLHELVWLLVHPHELFMRLIWRSEPPVTPSEGFAIVVRSLCCIPVLVICQQLAWRKGRFLLPYFVLWPIMVASSQYVAILIEVKKHHAIQVIVIASGVFLICILCSVPFYMSKKVRQNLFGPKS